MHSKPPSQPAYPLTKRAGSPEPLPDLSEYPDVYMIRKADLLAFSLEKGSARILSQLADILILLEGACARQDLPSTQPLADGAVFLLDLLIRINDPDCVADSEFSTHHLF